MCGRYALFGAPDTIQSQYRSINAPQWTARYNIAPSEKVPILRLDKDFRREFSMATWGWQSAAAGASSALLLNARAESLHEKPTFKTQARYARCVLPADGFYEWAQKGGVKTPWFFSSTQENQSFALAGLVKTFEDEGRLQLETLIVTTAANSLVSTLHHRMPVILQAHHIQDWLNPNLAYPLAQTVQPFEAKDMRSKQVSMALNQAGAEGVTLLTPDVPRQPSLF
jgi:putative SOS response-associated peptidase YedK